ncbi:hypothetical protein ASL20_09685 [Cupriavidus necator]|uniref:phage neck terminator protein n=1 Tax=Cupriavidus necator TaxID=106590 RepID=UPI00073546F2|nr:hypothetical protein [Cupriavidus necator]KUE88887.1 hypothetical protein ASL20_09685 [Cupriavidus necator]
MTAEQAIYELISGASDVPVIFGEENGPRPPKPYIALKVQWAHRFPLHHGAVDPAGGQTVMGHRDASVELQCFGASSLSALDMLAQRLGMERALGEAERLDLAVFEFGRASQVPVLRDQATYEPRAVLELGIRYSVVTVDAVGVIEEISARGELTAGATGTVPVDVAVP